MIQIAIADDHPMIINGIKTLLKNNAAIKIIASANNGVELLEMINTKKPNIVLCDINMPKLSGFEVLEKVLKNENGNTRFIMLSMHDEKPIIEKAFRLGAHGYLLKNSDENEMIDAIQRVAIGKKYFSDDVLEITMNIETTVENNFAKKALLSVREIEVVMLIVDGLSNSEIAEKLFISKRTVDAHRNNVLQKLEVKNTAQLVRFAIKSGIID